MKCQQNSDTRSPWCRLWLAVWLVVLVTAAPTRADDDLPEWLARLKANAESRQVQAADVLETIGRDWHVRRDKWDAKVAALREQGRSLTRDQLQRLADSSDGVMTVLETADGPVLEIDRVRLRRRLDEQPQNAREVLAEIFPELAAEAAAQYGMTVRPLPETAGDAPLPTHVIVLVHGLDEPGRLWRDLVPALHAQGLTAVEFDYPNDQPIRDSAALMYDELVALRRRGVLQVSIVAHSMGGLVAREVISSPRFYANDGDAVIGRPSIDRLITLGTPHGGSKLANLRAAAEVRDQVARFFSGDGMLFGGVFDGSGEAAADLLPDSAFLTALNARPLPDHVSLTVIASSTSPVTAEKVAAFEEQLAASLGAEAAREITDPIREVADGVGDGAVPLASSKWAGVEDYHLLQANHLTMIRNYTTLSTRRPPAIPLILDRLAPPAP